MSENSADPSRLLLRADFSSRIEEALQLKDWPLLERWSQQWIQLDPKCSSGFKWLARACLSQSQLQRAAYAYGRLLDFEPNNEEALQFFAQYPSSLATQPQNVAQSVKSAALMSPPNEEELLNQKLTPEKRRHLAEEELELAELYFSYGLYSQASLRFMKSFEWHPSKTSALGAAQSLHRLHRGLEAVKLIRQNLLRFPKWIEGRNFAGKILFDLGFRSDAQREWQLVLEQDPKNEEALKNLRRLLSTSV